MPSTGRGCCLHRGRTFGHSFDVRRVDARHLEECGNARATLARRPCTVMGLPVRREEGVIDRSPAVHIRRARIDYNSDVAHLDRNELGAVLVTAEVSSPETTPSSHCSPSLLRVSETIGADIDEVGLERGHRTLTVMRKGGKVATMPLAPRVSRAVDLPIGERLEGPIFIEHDTEPTAINRQSVLVGLAAADHGADPMLWQSG